MPRPHIKRRKNSKATPSHKGHVNRGDFDTTMLEVTHAMPRHKRLFSRFIHLDAVSSLSDFIGTTIARPNAMLFGAVASFIITLVVYLLSKNLGYSLSGSEPIVAFLIGWTIGITFDIITHFFDKK